MKSKKSNLEKRCLKYRNITNYKLDNKSYVIITLDGKNFSSYTKKLKKPFDEGLVEDMDNVSKFLCQNIEGAKFAYTQSDEINIFVADYEREETQAWFGYRLNKVLPLVASMATAYFNQLRMKRYDNDTNIKLAYFDAKAWTVPTRNDVFAWFLYRQIDCIRNSISMVAQSKYSHGELHKKSTDDMKEMLIRDFDLDWDGLENRLKFGAFIYKEEKILFSEKYGKECVRNKFNIFPGENLIEDGDWLREMIPFTPYSIENTNGYKIRKILKRWWWSLYKPKN